MGSDEGGVNTPFFFFFSDNLSNRVGHLVKTIKNIIIPFISP
jgi:hypothetical protein